MEEKQLVDTKRLARELGVTVRRVRQMVEEHILPPPNEDKKHDLERCQQRYRLYKYGTYDNWNTFYDEVEAAAKDMEKKFDSALKPGSTDEQIRAASAARRRVFEDMHSWPRAGARQQPSATCSCNCGSVSTIRTCAD